MSGRLILLLLAGLACGAAPAAAQESPTDVAASFFKAVAEERWRDAARLLELRAFDRYRREQVASMRLPMPESTITVEELLRHDPDMPRAAAEYRVRKAQEARRNTRERLLAHEYAGVTSLDSLAAMSAEEAAARWLQVRDVRWMSRRAHEEAVRSGRCPPGLPAGEPEVVAPHEIVGAVNNDSIAYVLHADPTFRPRRPDADLHGPGPTVMHLRRRGGRWQIVPRYDVLREGLGSFVSVECTPVDSAPRRRPGDR
jgi:hypothetical protein